MASEVQNVTQLIPKRNEPQQMRRFVVYEVWTRSHVVESPSEADVYQTCEPQPISGFSLCNWHVVEVSDR